MYYNSERSRTMKKILRMFVFPGLSLYLTSLWNKGFIVHFDPISFAKAVLLVGLVYYLIAPLLKTLLFPLNIITFGLASVIAYVGLFYFIIARFSIVEIKEWTFPGFQLFWLKIPSAQLNYWANLVVSSFSVSTIINLLESFL